MGFDTGVFSGPSGSLRLFTLILGAITVGITADSYYRGQNDEEFFFWTAVVVFIVSAVLALATFLGITGDAVFVRKGDSAFHIIGGIILLVSGIMFLIAVVKLGNNSTTARFVERLASGIIGILNSLVYCSLGMNLCRS